MMITTFEQVDITFAKLDSGTLKAAITGVIYKNRRPLGSNKEDVVINSLPVNNMQLSASVVNVNIHAPNLTVVVNGKTDNKQPNLARLKHLTNLAIADLSETWGPDYYFEIQQQILIEDEEYNDHYVNIRLDFFSININ